MSWNQGPGLVPVSRTNPTGRFEEVLLHWPLKIMWGTPENPWESRGAQFFSCANYMFGPGNGFRAGPNLILQGALGMVLFLWIRKTG